MLLVGETGTGKEVAAHALHECSRRPGPFVVVDCGALASGLVEAELFGYRKGSFTGAHESRIGLLQAADLGTLFLDELGELPVEQQSRLLRALETQRVRELGGTAERPVNIRVVAATNRSLEDAVRAGKFRPDLYFRLSVISLFIPPLRERSADIPLLATHFLDVCNQELSRALTFSPEVARWMREYRWPGNVRQLRNVIRYATVMAQGPQVTLEDLPESVRHVARLSPEEKLQLISTSLRELERAAILRELDLAHGDRRLAAGRLGIARSTLYRKLKELARLGLRLAGIIV